MARDRRLGQCRSGARRDDIQWARARQDRGEISEAGWGQADTERGRATGGRRRAEFVWTRQDYAEGHMAGSAGSGQSMKYEAELGTTG